MNHDFKKNYEAKVAEHNDLKRNASGYLDPTAYQAIMHADAEMEQLCEDYERYRKVIGCLLRVCELAGFSAEERFVLKDIRTGRVYK
jgi:hypothetical protein